MELVAGVLQLAMHGGAIHADSMRPSVHVSGSQNRHCGLAVPCGARVGTALALAGTAALVAGELATIPFRDQHLDDTGPAIVGSVFGLGVLLTAVPPGTVFTRRTS